MSGSFCSSCGHALDEGAHFCPECGTNVETGPAQPAVTQPAPQPAPAAAAARPSFFRTPGGIIGSGIVAAGLVAGGIFLATSGSGDDGPTAVVTQPPAVTTTAPATTTTTAPTPSSTAPPAATTTTEAVPEMMATTLADAREAVVRITVTGTFLYPDGFEAANAGFQGSGFIIDESGIAVTNNHVVTGAALLQVYVEGEERPRNARVLGVSECTDLAVIDIEGDGFRYVDWYDQPITTGLEIFAAGFPRGGNTEYTLLQGIVSKENYFPAEFSWASVDHAIEHTADIVGGSSGGPLLTADGKVVAINYATSTSGQKFAIGGDIAVGIVEQLRQELDVHSIGVNGWAFFGVDSGIFVSSVESGSPADRAGIQPGDLITTLEGIDLATDGSMKDYCDVLRSHLPSDVLAIEVWREDTGELMVGDLNGEVPLEPRFTATGGVDTTGVSQEYMPVGDAAGIFTMEVPTHWTESGELTWTWAGVDVGPGFWAAPPFLTTTPYGDPLVTIAVSTTVSETSNQMLDTYRSTYDLSACTYEGRDPYWDGVYRGRVDEWSNCEGTSTLFVIAARPEDRSFIILLEMIALTADDLEAFNHIVATFFANP